jgi:hypothetical protein
MRRAPLLCARHFFAVGCLESVPHFAERAGGTGTAVQIAGLAHKYDMRVWSYSGSWLAWGWRVGGQWGASPRGMIRNIHPGPPEPRANTFTSRLFNNTVDFQEPNSTDVPRPV